MKEQQNFTIRFFARKSRGAKNGKSLILVRVTVNSKRVEMTLKKEISSNLWDEKAQKCKGNTQLAIALNKAIESTTRTLYNIEQRLVLEGKIPTAEIVKARFNGLPDPDEIPNPTVLEFYDEHNRKFKELIGMKDHSESTYQRHLTSRKHVAAFIKYQYKKDDLDWEQVNFSFLNNFEHYFKAVRKCNHNSSIKYIKNFGKIIRLAIGEGYLLLNPFDKYKIHFETVVPVFLIQDEVDAVLKMETSIERLERVKDMFVFCIYTGISFCDVIELKVDDIYEDKDGVKWIKNNRLKTNIEFMVPILPEAQKIIDKYESHPERQEKGSVVPTISNQKYNSYLKEIADHCKIDKNISSHTARHTFATTITLTNNVPLIAVSKMMGHTNTKTTQIYAKVNEKIIKSGMSNLLNGKKKKKSKKKKNKKGKKGGKKND